MQMKSPWVISLAVLAAGGIAGTIVFDVDNPVLKGHVDKLKGAPSLTVTFTVNRIGSELEDQKLVLSKSGLLRWETPNTITIVNGGQIMKIDRKANTYYEEPADAKNLAELFNNDAIWAWSAVIDPSFMKPITDAKTGASRKVKGVAVKEVNVARGAKIVTLLVDDQLGFARGTTLTEEKGGQKNTVLIVASDIQVGKDAIAATDKSFMAPAGSTKVEKAAMMSSFKEVSAILVARCGCHQGGMPGGLSLKSYAGVMKGGGRGPAVVPGDAANSLIIGVIKGTKTPKMPPGGGMVPADNVAVIEKWINDGAKE